MTDLEISKTLALAIGWEIAVIQWNWEHTAQHCVVWINGNGWRVFDYRDWNVISPIAERYNRFPEKNEFGNWDCIGDDLMLTSAWNEDTPQKAIALAVIEGAKK